MDLFNAIVQMNSQLFALSFDPIVSNDWFHFDFDIDDLL